MRTTCMLSLLCFAGACVCVAGQTVWTGGSEGFLEDATNWSNDLPENGGEAVVNGSVTLRLRDTKRGLRGRTLELNDSAVLAAERAELAGATITLNDASRWEAFSGTRKGATIEMEPGKGKSVININGEDAVFAFDRVRLLGEADEGDTVNQIVVRAGRAKVHSLEGKGVVMLHGGHFEVASLARFSGSITFSRMSTGTFSLCGLQGEGFNNHDFLRLGLKELWERGTVNVDGKYGAAFDRVFEYVEGTGITLKRDFDPAALTRTFTGWIDPLATYVWPDAISEARALRKRLRAAPPASEIELDLSRIYPGSLPDGTAIPQDTVDVASPWLHVRRNEVDLTTHMMSFRLSRSADFAGHVIQSAPQNYQFWNPRTHLPQGTWYWTFGVSPDATPAAVSWHHDTYSFEITGNEQKLPLAPTGEEMLRRLKAKPFPFLHCNPEHIGRLLDVYDSAERQEYLQIVGVDTGKRAEHLQSYGMSVSERQQAIPSYDAIAASDFAGNVRGLHGAVRKTTSQLFRSAQVFSELYLLLGPEATFGGKAFPLRQMGLDIWRRFLSEYRTRTWQVTSGGETVVVRLSDAKLNLVSSDQDLYSLAAALDIYPEELGAEAVDVLVDLMIKGIGPRQFGGNKEYHSHRTGSPFKIWNAFEHRYYDQHWQQFYIFRSILYSTILARHTDEMDTWFRYLYDLFIYRIPSGSRDDGAWVSGNGYIGANLFTLAGLPVLFSRIYDSDCSLNFMDLQPWFRNHARYAVFSRPTGNPGSGYGDGVGWGVPGGCIDAVPIGNVLFDRITGRPSDPYEEWFLAFDRLYGLDGLRFHKFYKKIHEELHGTVDFNMMSLALTARIHESGLGLRSKPPVELARAFRDIGFVGMLTDHENPERNFFVTMRSCPYGAQMHAHPAQNAFNVAWKGQDLFYHTGFYVTGPYPFHDRLSYKATQAHNTILADGVSQVFDSSAGYGWLPRFATGGRISYALGDATNAYPKDGVPYRFAADAPDVPELGYGYPGVTRFRRHLVMLRPNYLLVYDELEAKRPIAWTFQLKSRDNRNMTKRAEGYISAYVDAGRKSYQRSREELAGGGPYGVGTLRLFCQDAFSTTVTDRHFGAEPQNVRNKYREGYQPHHHAYFTTSGRHTRTCFLAVLTVEDAPDPSYAPTAPDGRIDAHGYLHLDLDGFHVTAQMDGDKPSFLEVQSDDRKAALVTGQDAEELTLGTVRRRAKLRGATLLIELDTSGGDTVVEAIDELPPVLKYNNMW